MRIAGGRNMATRLLSLLCFASCAGMNFSHHQNVSNRPENKENFWTADIDFPSVSGDVKAAPRKHKKVSKRTPASILGKDSVEENTSLVKELQRKIEALSQEEYRKYIQTEQDLGGISEKIYYLGLSPKEREEYLKIRFYKNHLPQEIFNKRRGQNWRAFFDPRGYFNEEISLRMGKKEVISRWGPPTVVEIAGNPSKQNERWTFIHGRERKIIYFEGGKVTGWILPN